MVGTILGIGDKIRGVKSNRFYRPRWLARSVRTGHKNVLGVKDTHQLAKIPNGHHHPDFQPFDCNKLCTVLWFSCRVSIFVRSFEDTPPIFMSRRTLVVEEIVPNHCDTPLRNGDIGSQLIGDKRLHFFLDDNLATKRFGKDIKRFRTTQCNKRDDSGWT